MRNLAEYPIDDDEIIECLKALANELASEERIGDMRPLLLKEAAKRLEIAFDDPPWDEMVSMSGMIK